MKNIHKIFILAKITEELVQLYLRNKINEISVMMYNKVILNSNIRENDSNMKTFYLFNTDFEFKRTSQKWYRF